MGENLGTNDMTADVANIWRENSIQSFLAAHRHGARFVEMDVQVTTLHLEIGRDVTCLVSDPGDKRWRSRHLAR